jgi:hypothetical protein
MVSQMAIRLEGAYYGTVNKQVNLQPMPGVFQFSGENSVIVRCT